MHDPLVYDGAMSLRMLESLAGQWPEVEQGLAFGRPDLPTLLVGGELDPVVPLAVPEEVADRLPQATLREFAGDLYDVLNEHDQLLLGRRVGVISRAQPQLPLLLPGQLCNRHGGARRE